jgi:hypothetical protein
VQVRTGALVADAKNRPRPDGATHALIDAAPRPAASAARTGRHPDLVYLIRRNADQAQIDPTRLGRP